MLMMNKYVSHNNEATFRELATSHHRQLEE